MMVNVDIIRHYPVDMLVFEILILLLEKVMSLRSSFHSFLEDVSQRHTRTLDDELVGFVT